MSDNDYLSRLPYWITKKSLDEFNGKHITQDQIAQATGLRQATIARWMNKKPFKKIDMEVLSALKNYIGCRWYELIEEVPGSE